MEFKKLLSSLNSAQKEAVETIEGPVLVIAGPGTGKTQLLSARVANILAKTDVNPQNILCLTFTDSGAHNMRERLTRFIGKDAYAVNINTYHSFGDMIIKEFADEYLPNARLESSIDGLVIAEQLTEIIQSFPPRHPLRTTVYNNDTSSLSSIINDFKKARLDPGLLRRIAKANTATLEQLNQLVQEIFPKGFRMSSKIETALGIFENFLSALTPYKNTYVANTDMLSIGAVYFEKVAEAIEQAKTTNKTKVLTACKDKIMKKNEHGEFVLFGEKESLRVLELADVFEKYETTLAENGWYDFSDMIGRAIDILEKNDDVRYTLQERYQYILLDEFQDTNEAQADLIHLLCNNPVSEGRPNVLAVGDDDQAIYAFQGALSSNILKFHKRYRDTKIIALTENYRSDEKIITLAKNIAGQLSSGIFEELTHDKKILTAASKNQKECLIKRIDFLSQESENNFVAETIGSLIANGVSPTKIAVIAKNHASLIAAAPHLAEKNIPISYTKRDDVLKAPHILWILQIIATLVDLKQKNQSVAERIPEVLSYPFWNIPIRDIWLMNLSYNKAQWKKPGLSLAHFSLENASEPIQKAMEFLIALSFRIENEPAEIILEYILGSESLKVNDLDFSSGFLDWVKTQTPAATYDIISQINVLRAKTKDQQNATDEIITVSHILQLAKRYERASSNLLNTAPYSSAAESVGLLTAHSAKGLEFEYVFILNNSHESWGNARGKVDTLKLPLNMQHIRYTGSTEDERIRLFFVAVTRAKSTLYLTRHEKNYVGKTLSRLSYLDESEQDDGSICSAVIPAPFSRVEREDGEVPAIEVMQHSWKNRHLPPYEDVEMKHILRQQLEKFQISISHINKFLDVDRDGPQGFLMQTLLRFPSTPQAPSEFGTAMHAALEFAQNISSAGKSPLDHIQEIIAVFHKNIQHSQMNTIDRAHYKTTGSDDLSAYIAARETMFTEKTKTEFDFRQAGIFIEDAHLSGKIDRIEIDESTKTIRVADYKSGKTHTSFRKSDPKMLKYERQLYFYKILIESSPQWKNYTVTSGRLEFIQRDEETKLIAPPLEIDFVNDPQVTAAKITELKKLTVAIWRAIQSLQLPDITPYIGAPGSKGVNDFIDFLLQEKK